MPFFSRYSNSLLLQKKSKIVGANTFLNGDGANIFTVPNGVTRIHAVAVGGGGTGEGARSTQHAGGGGGGLGWVNNKSVTPGQQLLVFAGHGGNASVCSTTNWQRAIYEEAYGQDSFIGTLDVTIINCSAANTATPVTADISVNCTSTSGLTSGMRVVVGSGSGKLQNRTTVVSVTNSTAFIISSVPIRTLSAATIYASSNVFVSGYGGEYADGFNSASGISSSSYVNYLGGAGGSYIGDGGGTGGTGGNVGYFYNDSTTYGGSGGGGGGAGGYSGNGGNGGASNSTGAGNPTAGSNGSGGGGGGGCGSIFLSASAGYNTIVGSYGGGVGLYGEGTSGAGGTVFGQRTGVQGTGPGQSGIGGSGGGISNNYVVISTTYSGANFSGSLSNRTITATSSPNFSLIKAGWSSHGSGLFTTADMWLGAKANNTSGTASFQYASSGTSGTTASIPYWHSGRVQDDTDLLYGAGGAGGVAASGGRGAVRIIWGSGRAFPNTNVSTD